MVVHMNDQSPASSTANYGRTLLAKLRWIGIGLILLIMLLPLLAIHDLVGERALRKTSATNEVMEHFGRAQEITGPILTVPFEKTVTERRVVGGRSELIAHQVTQYAHFLPASLSIRANVRPSTLKRGLFEIVVFTADIEFDGTFDALDFSPWKDDSTLVHWDRASLSFDVSDRKALTSPIQIENSDKRVVLEVGPQEGRPLVRSLSANWPLAPDSVFGRFSGKFSVRGSERIAFVPVGGRTDVSVSSPWPHPSFDGAFLPSSRAVSKNGFAARWSVLRFGRDFGQSWTDGPLDTGAISRAVFGVSLKDPTNLYALITRSTRYSILFLLMTFAALYLWETMARKTIHPLQYIVFGCSLLQFYVIELALSEHVGFAAAYVSAAASTVLLFAAYARGVLASTKSASLLSALLAAVYAFLFFTLQLEDYALLLGTIGLTVLLAATMYATRRMNRDAQNAA